MRIAAAIWARGRLWDMTQFDSEPQLPAALHTSVAVVDALIRGGVREAVICPGSRSAPLAMALLEAARVHRLRVHTRIDERGAAFLALGLAKASNRPVPVLTTSGTAVANCLPAMVEATLTHTPLVMLSANRPVDQLGTVANQTIDQIGLFGTHAVATVSIAQDTDEVADSVAEALAAATDPITGGGVQLDVALDTPLVPQSANQVSLLAADYAHGPEPDQDAPVRYRPADRPLPHGEVTVDLSKRTLVIAGAVSDAAWGRRIMDELADIPTLAEPTAPAPDFPVHSAAAAMFQAHEATQGEYSAVVRPEQIIVIGRPTLHRAVSALLADPEIDLIALTDSDTYRYPGREVTYGSRLKVTGEHPASWLKVCQGVSDMGVEAVRAELSKPGAMTGVHAVAVVADSLRDGDAVVLGASTAIRDASRAGLPFDGVRAFANRGAAGIDGTIATAVGVSMIHASSDKTAMRAPRTIAVMGDLTFIHDLGSLNIGPLEPKPENLLIVVVNDNGGAIFENLEQGREELRTFDDGTELFERAFGTPMDVDIAAACDTFGVRHYGVDTVEDLSVAIDDHAEAGEPGITVIEVTADRGRRREIEQAIVATVTPLGEA